MLKATLLNPKLNKRISLAQRISDVLFGSLPIPKKISGKRIDRQVTCNICNSEHGDKVASLEYWDLKETDAVQCKNCGHIQLDPMLSDDDTQKGMFSILC